MLSKNDAKLCFTMEFQRNWKENQNPNFRLNPKFRLLTEPITNYIPIDAEAAGLNLWKRSKKSYYLTGFGISAPKY